VAVPHLLSWHESNDLRELLAHLVPEFQAEWIWQSYNCKTKAFSVTAGMHVPNHPKKDMRLQQQFAWDG